MQKIIRVFLFIILSFFISKNNSIYAMENLGPELKKTTEVIVNAAPAGNGAGINPAGKSWGETIISVLIKTTIAALVAVVINPETIKFLYSKINSKYAYELKMQQLSIINESLKIQLYQLKLHCRDKNVIKSMEATYLKSCIQIMELQKKYFERYAN